jgi:hypothetical protein
MENSKQALSYALKQSSAFVVAITMGTLSLPIILIRYSLERFKGEDHETALAIVENLYRQIIFSSQQFGMRHVEGLIAGFSVLALSMVF